MTLKATPSPAGAGTCSKCQLSTNMCSEYSLHAQFLCPAITSMTRPSSVIEVRCIVPYDLPAPGQASTQVKLCLEVQIMTIMTWPELVLSC